MSSTWIKMRVDLQTHPKVVRIVSALNADKCPHSVRDVSEKYSVIGGLHAVWSVFDAHSEDGKLDGYTFEIMDSLLSWPGFCAAMASVGWLEQDGETLVAPAFEEHNGQTAKRRAMETQRKNNARKLSALDADKNRTREEKRREEVNHHQESTTSTTPADSTKAPEKLSSSSDRAKAIAEKIVSLEAGRGLKAKISAKDSRVIAWAVAGVRDSDLIEAYGLAVVQRVEDGDASPINTGFLDIFIAKVMNQGEKGSAVKATIKEWFESAPGIEAKGKELGVEKREGEAFPYFKARVFAAAGHGAAA